MLVRAHFVKNFKVVTITCTYYVHVQEHIFCATDTLVIRSSKTLANHYCFMPQHVCCKAYGSLPVCQCVSICVCVCVYVSVFVCACLLPF